MKKILLILLILALLILIIPKEAASQVSNCAVGAAPPRAEGLVTASNLTGKFGNTGKCVVDPITAFVPYKLPGFDELLSLYFTQSKLAPSLKVTINGNATDANISLQP